MTLETKGSRLFRVPVTPSEGQTAQKGFACSRPWPRPSNPGGARCKDSGNRVYRGRPAALQGPRVCGLEASPSLSQRRQLRAPQLTWGQTRGVRAEGGDGNHLRLSRFLHSPSSWEVRSSALQGPLASRGRDPGLMGQGGLWGDLVWGLASLPLGSPPSRCERRRGAMGTRGACPSGHPSSPSGFPVGPWVCSPHRALGPRSVPIWRRRWSARERGQREEGGASRRVYLHSRHHGYLGAWTLSWPQCQHFSQPGAHRAPIPGSWQLGESGCSTPPAAGRQKTAPCVGTDGPIPLVTHSPGPGPLGIHQLPALPHPDGSFLQ